MNPIIATVMPNFVAAVTSPRLCKRMGVEDFNTLWDTLSSWMRI